MPQSIYDFDPRKIYEIPQHTCYACDLDAVGVTLHNGEIKAGCSRHANPNIKAKFACMYCGGFTRAGSLNFGDGPWDIAHRKCYEREEDR